MVFRGGGGIFNYQVVRGRADLAGPDGGGGQWAYMIKCHYFQPKLKIHFFRQNTNVRYLKMNLNTVCLGG